MILGGRHKPPSKKKVAGTPTHVTLQEGARVCTFHSGREWCLCKTGAFVRCYTHGTCHMFLPRNICDVVNSGSAVIGPSFGTSVYEGSR
jgi:hypothetical protein